MSVLEAMSYGDVVVSTYVGGIPKVIENGKNGFLVEAGDVAGLTKALVAALMDGGRQEIGQRAYQTISRNFNAKNNVNALVELYTECLSSHG